MCSRSVRPGRQHAHGARIRRGATLLELLVSLVLLVTVVSLGADLLAFQRQALARVAGEARAQTVLRHAAAPLLAHLRLLDLTHSAVVADTVIDALSTIADGVLCAPADATARILLPAPAGSDDAMLTGWRVRPDAGDVAIVTLPHQSHSNEWRATVVAVETVGAARCPHDSESPAPPDVAAVVVRLAVPPPDRLRAGAPVRLARRVRYSLYRTGDGSWALGHRRCAADPPALCQGVQPVTGPLGAASANPALTGMRVSGVDRTGNATTGSALAAATVVLRAPVVTPAGLRRRSPSNVANDSLVVRVAVRSAQ